MLRATDNMVIIFWLRILIVVDLISKVSIQIGHVIMQANQRWVFQETLAKRCISKRKIHWTIWTCCKLLWGRPIFKYLTLGLMLNCLIFEKNELGLQLPDHSCGDPIQTICPNKGLETMIETRIEALFQKGPYFTK